MKIGPATQVGHLVFAKNGERATERLGCLHNHSFMRDIMSKWHDMLSTLGESMSNARAADLLTRASQGCSCVPIVPSSIGSTLGVAAHGEPMDVIERQIAAGANQGLKTKNALGK